MEYKGWNEFEAGSVLFPFEKGNAAVEKACGLRAGNLLERGGQIDQQLELQAPVGHRRVELLRTALVVDDANQSAAVKHIHPVDAALKVHA